MAAVSADKSLYSIVIPVYRSAATLTQLYERIDRTFAGIGGDYELILVEDGGDDGSWEVMQSLRRRDARIKIIRLMRNCGQQNALMTGFCFVTGHYVITIDDDLQNPPEEIPKLIDAVMERNLDVVFGIPAEKKHSRLRKLGSRIFNRAVLHSFKQSVPDRISNVQVMKRHVAEQILDDRTPQPIVALLALRATDKIGTIIVEHHERPIGRSTYPMRILLRQFLCGILYYGKLPLRSVLLFGIGCCGLGLGAGVYDWLRPVPAGAAEAGGRDLIVLLLLGCGILSLCLWLVMKYLPSILQGMYGDPRNRIRQMDL